MSKQDNTKNLTSINSLCSPIKFSGEGIVDFLNNLLISDLKTFNHNQFYFSAFCNPKGRIIATVIILIKNANDVMLICPQNMDDYLINFFNLRKFRLKITILKQTQSAVDFTELTHNDLTDLITTTSIEEFYLKLFKNNLPWIDVNNSEKFIPQHVNLDQHKDIMSFTKGCYPGQEIIARLKYLGKIKKRMQLMTSSLKQELQSQTHLVSPVIQISPSHYEAQAINDTIIDDDL